MATISKEMRDQIFFRYLEKQGLKPGQEKNDYNFSQNWWTYLERESRKVEAYGWEAYLEAETGPEKSENLPALRPDAAPATLEADSSENLPAVRQQSGLVATTEAIDGELVEDDDVIELVARQLGSNPIYALPAGTAEEEEGKEFRFRSIDSDGMTFLYDDARVGVMKDMGLIGADVMAATPEQVSKALEGVAQLTEEQESEVALRMTDKAFGDNALFSIIPPRVLTEAYNNLKSEMASAETDEKRAEIEAKFNRVAGRMDDLSEQFSQQVGLYFADTTNITDVYEGYGEMFAAREGDLVYSNDEKDIAKLAEIKMNRVALEGIVDEYDTAWGLHGITENDAARISARYDALGNRLPMLSLDMSEETMTLMGNYRFLDENGAEVSQFFDPKTNEEFAEWTPGRKIIPGSQMETVTMMAWNDVLMSNLTSDEQFTDEGLRSQIEELVKAKLFAIDSTANTFKGYGEEIDQFTNPTHFQKFLAELSDTSKPKSITMADYGYAVDAQINTVAGYADRLASKIGRDKEVIGKLFEPVARVDKMASARMGRPDRQETISRLRNRAVKGFAKAALMSTAITMAATMASDVAGMADGRAVFAMGIGTVLALTSVSRNIMKWRRENKEQGRPAGFMELLKDQRMRTTMATTALGSLALGFTVAGMPNAATACGVGAMALGTGQGVVATYKDAMKGGLTKSEAVKWSLINGAAIVLGGISGRGIGGFAVEQINANVPDNTIFQHSENVAGDPSAPSEHDGSGSADVLYKDGVVQDADRILNMWYKDNPQLLQDRIAAIDAYNAEHGTDYNPQRMLLVASDAGLRDAGGISHKVFGQGWQDSYGVSGSEVKLMANLFNKDGSLNMSPETGDAFRRMDGLVDSKNHVGVVPANTIRVAPTPVAAPAPIDMAQPNMGPQPQATAMPAMNAEAAPAQQATAMPMMEASKAATPMPTMNEEPAPAPAQQATAMPAMNAESAPAPQTQTVPADSGQHWEEAADTGAKAYRGGPAAEPVAGAAWEEASDTGEKAYRGGPAGSNAGQQAAPKMPYTYRGGESVFAEAPQPQAEATAASEAPAQKTVIVPNEGPKEDYEGMATVGTVMSKGPFAKLRERVGSLLDRTDKPSKVEEKAKEIPASEEKASFAELPAKAEQSALPSKPRQAALPGADASGSKTTLPAVIAAQDKGR